MSPTIPESVVRSSRPMLFEYDDDHEYPYYYSGTFFYCIWAGRLFAVTARHVIADKDLSTVRLLCHDASREFLGLESTLTVVGEEHDYKDLAVIAVMDHRVCGAILDGLAALDPKFIEAGAAAFTRGRQLIVSGYPHDLKEIDYESLRLSHQRLVATAEYACRDTQRAHIHQLRWIHTEGETNLKGMSGSIVLCASDGAEFGLCGVLIEGQHPASPGYFIDSGILVGMLRTQVADRLLQYDEYRKSHD
jgi:hypothetical protein